MPVTGGAGPGADRNVRVQMSTTQWDLVLAAGSADSPRTTQETAKVMPISTSARLDRIARTSRSTAGWTMTIRIVLTVSASGITRTGTRATTTA